MNDFLEWLSKKIDKFDISVGPRTQKIIKNQENPWKFEKKSQILGPGPRLSLKFADFFD